MKRNNFGYFVGEGVTGVWKNSLMSIASIGVLVACLLIMGMFIMISSNISAGIKDLEDKNEIVVFIEDEYDMNMVEDLEQRILANDNIRESIFVSSEEAFEIYKQGVKYDISILDGIESPIRNSFRIFLVDLSLMHETMTELESMEGVARVRGREDVSANLIHLQKMLAIIMLWFFVILGGISIFIISNTIKLAMFARKKEINIMKHVGATDWFIRWPFVVEGIVIGILSGLISWLFSYYIYNYVMEKVLEDIQIFTLLPYSVFGMRLFAGFLVSGVLVGITGSMMSVRKYLKA